MPGETAMQKVPDEVLPSFAENGFLIAESVFTAEEMAACKTAAKKLVENSSGSTGVHVWMCDTIPPLFELISCDPRMAAILRPLIGPASSSSAQNPYSNQPRSTSLHPGTRTRLTGVARPSIPAGSPWKTRRRKTDACVSYPVPTGGCEIMRL